MRRYVILISSYPHFSEGDELAIRRSNRKYSEPVEEIDSELAAREGIFA